MTRITRSVTALTRSLLNPKPPIQVQKKPLKLTKGQRGQVAKRIDAIGKLREAKILQNIAINKLGVGQIPQSHPRKERVKKKTFSKKKENVRERNAKKASLGVENVKEELRGLCGTKEESGQTSVKEENGQKMENQFVMFDLESTGLGTNTAQIIQIAALPLGNSTCQSFNRFILPTVPIHWGATMVHGMKVKDGRLVRRGEDLGADEDAAGVLQDFFRWCSALEDQKKNVVLVAHNGARFDFPLLFSMARRFSVRLPTKLKRLQVADSLSACKPFKEEFGNCKLANLKRCLVKGGGSQTHDALDDCGDLGEVIVSLANKKGVSTDDLLKESGAIKGLEKYSVQWADT